MKIVSFEGARGHGIGALTRGGIDVWEGFDDVVAWLEAGSPKPVGGLQRLQAMADAGSLT